MATEPLRDANALDAMPAGGTLTLEGQGTAPQVSLKVRDTGRGIPAAQRAHIFEPLYTTKPGGTGLGLYLVQEIVTAHGGHVTVQSVEGQGTTFTLTLPRPATILVIDIGGSKVKMLVTGETSPRKFQSGKRLTPAQMVAAVHERTEGWTYEAISIGYPGVVGARGPRSEPGNLGPGWVGFNFAAAFDCPVRIINDAAMQALGNYDGGRMLFLGLGTGLGSALIADRVIVPLELGHLPYPGGPLLDHVLGQRGLQRLGKKAWRRVVHALVPLLMETFLVDYVVLGGGNAKQLNRLPPGTRLGHNQTAFRGGFRACAALEDGPHPCPLPRGEGVRAFT
jgi:polyphosphate glucokinase